MSNGIRQTNTGVVVSSSGVAQTILSSTPDTSMFQSPIYQFWAGDYGGSDGDSPVPFPEVLAGLSDASAAGGPTYNADYNGLEVIDYDGTDDAHDWTADGQLPTASDAQVSIFVVFYTTTNSSFQRLSGYGTDDVGATLYNDGSYALQTGGGNDVTGGSYPTNQLDTMGITYDVGTGDVEVYGGGSSTAVATGSTSAALGDSNHGHARRASNNDLYLSGGIAEIVYCDVLESGSAYADFHTDRLG